MEQGSSNVFDFLKVLVKYVYWFSFIIVAGFYFKPIVNSIEDKVPDFLENVESIEYGSFKYKAKSEAKQVGKSELLDKLNGLSKKDVQTLLFFGNRTWAITSYSNKILYVNLVDQLESLQKLKNKGLIDLSMDVDEFFGAISKLGFYKIGGIESQHQYTSNNSYTEKDLSELLSSQAKMTKKGEELTTFILNLVSDELQDKNR